MSERLYPALIERADLVLLARDPRVDKHSDSRSLSMMM
jgi:hypothetical protein